MKEARIFLALVLCCCVMSPQVFAQQDIWEKANSDVYKEKAGPMLVRGLLNVVTSPVDILVQTVDKTKDGPPLIGTLTGLAGGLGCTALRVGSGLTDVALFWVPGFNGFPVNRSYHDCILCEETEVEVVEPVYVASSTPQAGVAETAIVTVSEEPATTPKKKIRDPYQYVKK